MHTSLPNKFTFFVIFFLLFGTCGVDFARAQGLSVKVQPTLIEKAMDPGQTEEGFLTITNENGGTQTYVISSRNITGMNDFGTPTFSNELTSDPLEAASWLKVDVPTVTLAVGESVQVPYRIEVPVEASPGSHFAAFFVIREAEEAVESGAGVGFYVASLVGIRVSGEVLEDMMFREFKTGKHFFTEPEVFFTATVENTGTIHQRPLGIITVKDMLGNDVGSVTFNDSAGVVLPSFDRIFEATWAHEGFALGRYTAIASVVYGESEKRTLTREVNFWVVPVKEVAIALGTIATVILLFIYGVKRYIRKTLERSGYSAQQRTAKETKQVTFARRLVRNLTWVLVLLAITLLVIVVSFG